MTKPTHHDASIPRYTYRPLPPGVFRLFQFCSVTTPNSPLLAKCIETRFDDPLSYEALSYCWAGHERTLSPEEWARRTRLDCKVLIVSNSSDATARTERDVVGFIPISAPLEDALSALCNHTAQPLFVDQLCINQTDNAEKSVLVRRMGDIYASAQRVLAWLGPMTPEAEAFSKFVGRRESKGPPAYHRLDTHDEGMFDVLRSFIIGTQAVGQPIPDHILDDVDVLRRLAIKMKKTENFGPLRGFVDVCSRAFFGRMWIVQEVCLPNNIRFICGNSAWDAPVIERAWRFFRLFLAYFGQSFSHEDLARAYPTVDDVIFTIALCRFINRLFSTRRALHSPGTVDRLPAFRLLAKFNTADKASRLTADHDLQKYRCGDPRDCYYALHALLSPEDPTIRRVAVDYNLPPQQVFIDLAGAIATDDPDVLLFSQHDGCPERLSNLPSWVPDWSSQLALPHSYLTTATPHFTAGLALSEEEDPWIGASATHVDGAILMIAGRRLGSAIGRVGKYMYFNPHSIPDLNDITHHQFLHEIEFFCRLAETAQHQSPPQSNSPSHNTSESLASQLSAYKSPPILPSTRWLMATGGFGLNLAPTQPASADGISQAHDRSVDLAATRLGPLLPNIVTTTTTTGNTTNLNNTERIPLLGLAYTLHRRNLARRVRVHELTYYRRQAMDQLAPIEAQWQAFQTHSRLWRAVVAFLERWFGLGRVLDKRWEAWEFVDKFHRWYDEHDPSRSGPAKNDSGDDGNVIGGGQADNEETVSARQQVEAVQGKLGNLMDVQQGRRCFLTHEGFVGLGPRGMKVGDVVVVLKGASVPVVLRHSGQKGQQEVFRYVGEAYCYGVMDGEWTEGKPQAFHIV
ncbi:hypothetical protein VTJ04DRAFT_1919 [Mycothermus thermophilus]|uniref:uncharacterized protein n=1 Tax=Humicola insolens TaxID=85995 RepID=UPI003744ABFF